jgi:hypothetical protein
MVRTPGLEIEWQDRPSWRRGFADGLAGKRSPRGARAAYRAGYIAGSAQRVSRRTMMAAALAMLAIPDTAALATPASDPIFAAIEKHRQAWEALNGAGVDQAQLHEAVLAAESDLVATRPSTSAGVAALRAYHHEARRRLYRYPYHEEYYYPRDYYWGWGKG